MITETLTLNFQDEAQQRRFHERLNASQPSEDEDATMVAEFQGHMVGIIKQAMLTEREACASLLDTIARSMPPDIADSYIKVQTLSHAATAIRGRSTAK